VIEVDDSGPGIEPAERALVVQPWVRGSAGQDAPGTGLGLSLAVDAITRCGGRLEFDDAASGGACIRLVLPLADSQPAGDPVAIDLPVEPSEVEPSGTAGYAGDVDVDRLDPAH
jgi:K+-sensing histidine kinase KdpD